MGRRDKNSKFFLALSGFAAIIVLIIFIYSSKSFERNVPKIELDEVIHWNLRKPIEIKISDDSSIKFVRVILSDGENNITLINERYDVTQTNMTFNIDFPKTGFFSKKNEYILSTEVVDKSWWKFLSGNSATKSSKILVDTKRPDIYVVANSYKVTQGGAGAVIFKATDDNLKDIYVETNYGKIFKVAPFYKGGYYISLIAWPSNEKNFSASVFASDLAGNEAKSKIKYYIQDKAYKTSTIKLNDDFLNGAITDLADDLAYQETKDLSSLDKFKFINEVLRSKSASVINDATSSINSDKPFKIKAFSPLKNGAAVASFGDHRIYEYKKAKVSESYHLGLDLASVAEADIVISNAGKVVFAGESGLYGNLVIVDHGLGIYSLYAHCSAILVNAGDEVLIGDIIGKTGKTGFAFGDHLHFGVAVQGVEVWLSEWMDSKWIKENIFDIIDSAKDIIDRR